ncbi:MAG: ATP-binding protein [Alteromonas oceani]
MKKISVRAYSFIATFIIFVVAMIADHYITASYNQSVVEDVQINLREVEALIKNEYASYRDDLFFLYSTPPISGLTRAASNNGLDPLDNTTTAQWQNQLTNIFRGFMENNRSYYQLRLLDQQGNETIRVERKNGRVSATTESNLQNKGDRYYFTTTKMLGKEQLFVSNIDLNREYGRIAFPHQPTLRLALPIFSDGEFFGVLIANIDVSELLDELEVLIGEHLDVVLTDYEQYFVKHPQAELAFTRDLAPDRTFSSEYRVNPAEIGGLKRFASPGAGASALGASKDIFVAAGETSLLHVYLLVNDDYYLSQLTSRRLESMAGLGAVLVFAVFALQYLGSNNQRLSKLLVAAEEAKAAVDVAEDAVITVSNNWRINTYNQSFERMFLLKEQQVREQKFTDLLRHLGGEEVAESLELHLGTGVNGAEWHRQGNGGISKWYHCKVNKIDNSQAEAAYAIVIRDITVEKESLINVAETNRQLEEQVEQRTEELKKARDEALELSQLKTNFISTISHEMRTPLNGIVGATTLLRGEALTAKQSQLLTMAEGSVDNLKHLINDILDLSKIEAGKLELDFQNFNPEALIEGITSTMSVVASQKGIGFFIDTSELNFTLIHSDPHRLTQVVNNVLNNAIKFTSEGYVLLTSRSVVEHNNASLVFEITDTGKGIPLAQQGKLFTAFSQADETIAASYGGTGLGLSICREILSLLNGSISVESEEQAGSTFTIKVPLELWQVREEEEPRLADCNAGLLIESEPLEGVLQHLLVCNGAEPMVYHRMLSLTEVQSCTYLLVEQSSSYYGAFAHYWQQWVAEQQSLPSLFVIAKSASDADHSLPQATVLVQPLYRSVFLSNVIDSRAKQTSSSIQASDSRRSSDVRSDHSRAAVDISAQHILIVDDNEINRQVAQFILEPYGPTVLSAVNGAEAVEQLRHNPDINMVLMDCNMPVLNGYDATRAIRGGQAGEGHRDIPVIAMTANALKGESEKCYEAGMNNYLTKPIDAGEFIEKITGCLSLAKVDKVPNLTHVEPTQAIWQCEEALVRLDNNKALLKKLLSLFINESHEKRETLAMAIAAEDREKVRFTAHAFKGNAADVGADAFKEMLNELEYQAKTATKNEMQVVYERIVLQLPLLIAQFEQFIEEN